ncbi:FK506-binding protein-like [Gigantopelta aegis]|uniref:FK506-binding protein-like n=1 Tax=Gigantopelta aegis TaxID=1735272 RepID=UPI001B88882B|nr:FK506-binding protein-like [Gigantopelta aegis]XP_041370550.1 FK506-binding protein-like [Gigantopelta aegis]
MDVDADITLMDTETEAQMASDMMSLAVGAERHAVTQEHYNNNMMENADRFPLVSDAAGLSTDMTEVDKATLSSFTGDRSGEGDMFSTCDKLTSSVVVNSDCCQMTDCTEMVSEKLNIHNYGGRFSKQIVCDGHGILRPQDGTKCLVSLFISTSGCDVPQSAKCLGYLFGTDIEIEIGESYSVPTEQIDLCLLTMKAGEICETKMFDHMNEDAMMGKLPETFTLQIHLKSFTNGIPIWQLSPEDKFSLAHVNKNKGTEYFRTGNIEYAFKRFSKALKYLICMSPEENIPQLMFDDYSELRCRCYMNLAACQMKSRRYDFVITNCSNALTLNPKKVKALYRRAQAFLHLNDLDGAKSDLTLAATLDPSNKAVLLLQNQVLCKQAENDSKMADSLSKMFTS